jgi:eukaryotic-like serine/threonine-protein kinase
MTDGLRVGRYVIYDEFAAGGMATVHLGRLLGPAGFSRTVAIKRLHPQYAKDPEFVAMLLDEARLAGRIRHPNVVTTLDVVASRGELFLVMEYVSGDSFSALLRASSKHGIAVEPGIVSAIIGQALLGLQAAHEATDERGRPLRIVHRDVSPQNVLVGTDGTARMVDFGVAKAASRTQTTSEGQLKGKLAYMAPEQLLRRPVDHRADLFAAGIMIWEALVGKRLFASDDPAAAVARVLACEVEPPSRHADLPRSVDDFTARALAPRPSDRFATGREMAIALHAALPPASTIDIGEWVAAVGGSMLQGRAQRIAELESSWPEAMNEGAPWPQIPERALPAAGARNALPTVPDPAPVQPSTRAGRLDTVRLTPARAAAIGLLVAAASIVAFRLFVPVSAPANAASATASVALVPEAPPPVPVEALAGATADAAAAVVQNDQTPAPPPRRAPRSRAPSPPQAGSGTVKPGLSPIKDYQ